MSGIRRTTIRKLYRQGLLEVFGCGDQEMDEHLVKALKKDIHLAGRAPGKWVSEEGILEIYCENGIPNATDYVEPGWYGCEGPTVWNSESWNKVDKYVNLYLEGMGHSERIFHEPHNSAVVAVHWA
tara:strand:- start:1239 stop:1616 length:378 start_codon:yes stop_codon:yes gene_type:complete